MTQDPVAPQPPDPAEPSGSPTPQPPAPAAYPYPPVAYPQSVPPGYPHSAPPGYPQSAPPGYVWPVDASGQPLPAPTTLLPAPPQPGRRKTAIIVSAVAAAVVAIAVTTVVLVKVNAEPEPTGQEAVVDYLNKLVAGDIEGALTHVDPVGREDIEDQPLLDPQLLADPETRPTGFQVISRVQTSETSETVTVTYTIGDTKITENYRARRSTPDEPWVIEAPFHHIEIEVDSDRAVRVNGVLIRPGRTTTFLAFPGLYRATLEGDALFDELAATGEISGGNRRPVYHEIDLTDADLRPDAEEKVQTAVNAMLDGCEQDHAKKPTMTDGEGARVQCPFYLSNTENFSVTWSVARYPDIAITPTGDKVFVTATQPGLVRFDVPYPWIDGSFEFPFRGTAYADGEVVKVTFFG